MVCGLAAMLRQEVPRYRDLKTIRISVLPECKKFLTVSPCGILIAGRPLCLSESEDCFRAAWGAFQRLLELFASISRTIELHEQGAKEFMSRNNWIGRL